MEPPLSPEEPGARTLQVTASRGSSWGLPGPLPSLGFHRVTGQNKPASPKMRENNPQHFEHMVEPIGWIFPALPRLCF